MRSIPRDGSGDAVPFCHFCEEVPSVPNASGPVPSGQNAASLREHGFCLVCGQIWDEVASEPYLVRALPRSRFRSAFGYQLRLPAWKAECLEDFEAELYRVGLIGLDEIISDTFDDGYHFGVEKRNHGDASYRRVDQDRNSRRLQREGTSPPASLSALGRGSRIKGLSGAPLEPGEPLVRQGGPSTHLCENPAIAGGAKRHLV